MGCVGAIWGDGVGVVEDVCKVASDEVLVTDDAVSLESRLELEGASVERRRRGAESGRNTLRLS